MLADPLVLVIAALVTIMVMSAVMTKMVISRVKRESWSAQGELRTGMLFGFRVVVVVVVLVAVIVVFTSSPPRRRSSRRSHDNAGTLSPCLSGPLEGRGGKSLIYLFVSVCVGVRGAGLIVVVVCCCWW